MKKDKMRKVLLSLLLFFMVAVVGFMLFKQTCVEKYMVTPVFPLGDGEVSQYCPQFLSVWAKLTMVEIFWTLFTVVLIYGIFFFLFKRLLSEFFTSFKGKNLYKKVFFVELGLILLFAFLWFSFWVAAYDGTSCLLDNCVDMSFIEFFSFWGIVLGLAALLNPVSIAVLGLPYILVFGYTKMFLKKTKSNS